MLKPGILKLAQQTQRPIIAGAAACSRSYVFKKTWNQCYLPLPFAKCIMVYGDPIHVPENISPEQFENLRLQLELDLKNLKAEAESFFEKKPTKICCETGCSAGG